MQHRPSIVPLAARWEEYLVYDPEGNLEQFGAWLQQKERVRQVAQNTEVERPAKAMEKTARDFYSPDHYAGYLIGRLFKFVRFYMKPVIQQGALSSLDDWVFLATLYELGEANKKDLIHASLSELTTGLDIIRRLVRHGIFAEKVDANDRRAKLLTVTQKGKQLMQETVIGLQDIPAVLPNLSETEQTYLISILEALDRYHTQAFDKK